MENLNDLRAFLSVAETGSFTKAAAKMGISQSALSYTVRSLENRLKIKLLERTTRSVSTTSAGEELRLKIKPLFSEIDSALLDLDSRRGKLSGLLRINGNEHVLQYVLKDRLIKFSMAHPEIKLELISENRFIDIITDRFDIGIRPGDHVAKDMIAVRISADMQMVTAAGPAYLEAKGAPQTPFELGEHNCLAFRQPTMENLMSWEYHDPKQKKSVRIRPEGQIVSNDNSLLIHAAIAGEGLIWLPKDMLTHELQRGELVTVLDDWAMSYAGYYLYYPSRRADSPIFQAFVKAMRWRE